MVAHSRVSPFLFDLRLCFRLRLRLCLQVQQTLAHKSGQSPGFQCLIVTKTSSHGLLELDPLRTQAPSSCEHPFPLFESTPSNQEA